MFPGPAPRAQRPITRRGVALVPVDPLPAGLLTERGDEGFSISASFGTVALPEEAGNPLDALRIADQRMCAQKAVGRGNDGRESCDVLLQALTERHPDLGGHLTGVAIPDAILNKPGPLDDEEQAFMRRHTLIGERIVSAAPALAGVARLVRASHERWDGDGYPDALAGTDIPLGARIVAVCDAFDVMVTDRAYRRGRTIPEALIELQRCAGTQFDPAIVDAFSATLEARVQHDIEASASRAAPHAQHPREDHSS